MLKFHSRIPFVFLLFCLAVCAAAPGVLARNPESIDLMKVTPADFTGMKDAQDLYAEADRQYRKKDYEATARTYIQLLYHQPQNSIALYNLACCYGLLGADKQAARFLEASWEQGFRELSFVNRDPDFDKVRESKVFQKTLQKLEKKSENLPLLLGVPSERLALFRLQQPDKVEEGKRYPLYIGLHGAGGNDEDFVEFLREGSAGVKAYFCAVQGPYADDRGSGGFRWFRQLRTTDRQGPEPQSLQMSADAVVSILDEVLANYPIDPERVFLVGFSQGAYMTYYVGLKHPGRFKGIAAVGGDFPQEDFTGEELKAAASTHILICTSPEDTGFVAQSADAAEQSLKKAGLKPQVHSYHGGHVFTDELLRKILVWAKNK